MIVALTGYARAGKDTVGDFLVGQHNFARVSFAHRLKAMALELDPILEVAGEDGLAHLCRLSAIIESYGDLDKAKELPAVRRFLQDLGVTARRHIGSNVWVTAALGHLDQTEDIVVTDCRFRNEAEAVKAKGGVVVRVTRPGVGAVNTHVSEHDLADWPVEATIVNGGSIEDLGAQVADLVQTLSPRLASTAARARALQAAGPDEFPPGYYEHLAQQPRGHA